MNRGQTSLIPLIIGGAFTLLASIGGAWFTGQNAANTELNNVKLEIQKADAELEKLNAVQDEKITTMKDDISEIKSDIKSLLQVLGVKSVVKK